MRLPSGQMIWSTCRRTFSQVNSGVRKLFCESETVGENDRFPFSRFKDHYLQSLTFYPICTTSYRILPTNEDVKLLLEYPTIQSYFVHVDSVPCCKHTELLKAYLKTRLLLY